MLSGSPFLNGAIAMLFSADQAGIAFDGGFFNAIGSTRVTAYGRDGPVLGWMHEHDLRKSDRGPGCRL